MIEIVELPTSSGCTAGLGKWILRKSLQNAKCDESLQSLSNAQPAYSWVSYLVWQTSHWEEMQQSMTEMNQGTKNCFAGYDWFFAGQ